VISLTRRKVTSSGEVIDLLHRQAYPNRATVGTKINQHSSRSHWYVILFDEVKMFRFFSVIYVYITTTTKNNFTSETTRGKLVLVDLAGSENVKKSGATGKVGRIYNYMEFLTASFRLVKRRRKSTSHY